MPVLRNKTALNNQFVKFIIFDFCESIKVHKKTTHVSFLKFTTFDNTSRKYDSILSNNGFFKFNYGFNPGKAYKLTCKINHDFPSSIEILESKEL